MDNGIIGTLLVIGDHRGHIGKIKYAVLHHDRHLLHIIADCLHDLVILEN